MPRPPWKHMSVNDVPLFASFVLSPEGQRFERWDFDLRVGNGRTPAPGASPEVIALTKALSQLRIDAVGYVQTQPTIFEVKPNAHLSAFGQVIAYAYFYLDAFGVVARRAIITDHIAPDVAQACRDADIDVHLVAPATPSVVSAAAAYTQSLPSA